MLIRKLEEIRGTDRSVSDKGWESSRMLLAEDGMGFSFHITTLRAGGEWTFHYQHHVESVFVISGRGGVENLATGGTEETAPGPLHCVEGHCRANLRAHNGTDPAQSGEPRVRKEWII